MKAIEVVKEQVGEGFIWFLDLPSYKVNEKRGLVIVKPSPSELMFGEGVERGGVERVVALDSGEEVSYKVVALNDFLKKLFFGRDLDVFLSVLNKNNLDVDTSDELYIMLFKMINEHYRELSEELNGCNYANALILDSKSIGVAGDALYLSKNGLDRSTNVAQDILRYNEMMFKTKLMEFHLGTGDGVFDYQAKAFEAVDEEMLSRDTEEYARALEGFKGRFQQYMQPEWSDEETKWVNSILCLSLKLVSR